MEADTAYSLIDHAIASDRVANAYLIVGDVRGNASDLVRRLLARLGLRSGHPDLIELGPEKKSRIISVESVKTRLVEPMDSTSFSGGWKVGVIYGADRMRAEAANAFLKTLEEPTPQTLFLLLSDAPEAMLPTIISRCQRVDLKVTDDGVRGAPALPEDAADEIREAVRNRDEVALVSLLTELKEDADEADVQIVRKAFYKVVMGVVRETMVKAAQRTGETPAPPLFQAFKNVRAVEEAYAMSEKAMNDEAVLSLMLDRITL